MSEEEYRRHYQRIYRMPVMLENTRRKLRMLEQECEKYGLRHLLEDRDDRSSMA
jgi:hypothetical protein